MTELTVARELAPAELHSSPKSSITDLIRHKKDPL
ncbi:hypothetical protein [Pseudomonas sp. 22 E 5]|nr:hypothetical protein [Pseudomonas sp. 31 E 5]CRM30210.1 hypothetical protein [Pseudomonas sp. 31 E 6]CRM96539.1 hypothetical protein [Pseudomonas sp. 22 E 5]